VCVGFLGFERVAICNLRWGNALAKTDKERKTDKGRKNHFLLHCSTFLIADDRKLPNLYFLKLTILSP
jgi:hypothetical protein